MDKKFSNSNKIICKYNLRDACKLGKHCNYSHDLSGLNISRKNCWHHIYNLPCPYEPNCRYSHNGPQCPELEVEAGEIECIVCYSTPSENMDPFTKNFAVMENCCHALCAACSEGIRKFDDFEDPPKCPYCRQDMGRILYSPVCPTDVQHKNEICKLIMAEKKFLSHYCRSIPCKYGKHYRNPSKCPYLHDQSCFLHRDRLCKLNKKHHENPGKCPYTHNVTLNDKE